MMDGKTQDILCKISDAAFGGELAWETMGLDAFAAEISRRLKDANGPLQRKVYKHCGDIVHGFGRGVDQNSTKEERIRSTESNMVAHNACQAILGEMDRWHPVEGMNK